MQLEKRFPSSYNLATSSARHCAFRCDAERCTALRRKSMLRCEMNLRLGTSHYIMNLAGHSNPSHTVKLTGPAEPTCGPSELDVIAEISF